MNSRYCDKCGAITPARWGKSPMRCVHCHADFIVFITCVVGYGASFIWGI